jgi:hypothetical protein
VRALSVFLPLAAGKGSLVSAGAKLVIVRSAAATAAVSAALVSAPATDVRIRRGIMDRATRTSQTWTSARLSCVQAITKEEVLCRR